MEKLINLGKIFGHYKNYMSNSDREKLIHDIKKICDQIIDLCGENAETENEGSLDGDYYVVNKYSILKTKDQIE